MHTGSESTPESLRKPRSQYHHGDLRTALLVAVRAIILRDGLDALSLRACAREAGVSASAPAHHFRDKRGLLTEFAVEGFELLGAVIRTELEAAGADPVERVVAVGRGYIRFALANPAHFQVMWRKELIDRDDPRIAEPACYNALCDQIRAYDAAQGVHAEIDPDRTLYAWCLVHGFATLWLEGETGVGYEFGAHQDTAMQHAEGVLRWTLVGLLAQRVPRP